MGIVVFGATFVDIKGYPDAQYIPAGRNVGKVIQVHGGVSRNVVEDIANIELKPTYVTVLDYSGTSSDVIEKLNKHNVD
ncbi:MAG: carbohydrate kinase family protein, partial [Erysipelotrichaceae bacterium]|nr:carbohydrate kinase family protein [Erysipelotrichaceae bacterium]